MAVRDESSQIVRLSTRDVAPADSLSYASWILDSALAPSVLSTPTPSKYKLNVSVLALPSIAIVAAGGSPSRSVRGPSEIRRTSQRYFALALVLSGSWNFTSVTRDRFGPGDLIFYDSRYLHPTATLSANMLKTVPPRHSYPRSQGTITIGSFRDGQTRSLVAY